MNSKSLRNIQVVLQRWKAEGEAAYRLACFSHASPPSFDFAIMILSGTHLATLVLCAIGAGGFIGYVHGRFLLLALAPFCFIAIIHQFLKRSAAKKQWRMGEFVRIVSCASIANILLPVVAILSWIHVAFFDFTNLIIAVSSILVVAHSFLYLRNRVVIGKWPSVAIVGGAFLSTCLILWIVHSLLFPNPWAYLSEFLPSQPR